MSKIKNIILNSLQLKNGKVVYDDLNINPALSFAQQKWSFKEDMLQIDFNNKYLIDVGWYPEFQENGAFLVIVIKDFDWENSLFEKRCQDLGTLKKYLQEAIDLVSCIH